MMKIKQENIILLTDVGRDVLDQHFDALSDEILSHTEKLTNQTGIGNTEKFAAGGLNWNILKDVFHIR